MRNGAMALTVSLLSIAALLPLATLLSAFPWLPLSMVLIAVVACTGWAVRSFLTRRTGDHPARRGDVVAPFAQLVVWILATTGLHTLLASAGALPESPALLGVIPTPQVLDAVPAIVASAAEELIVGVAPLRAAGPLTFVLVAAAGLLALGVDLLATSARMPVLAVVFAAAVAAAPVVAVPGPVDPVAVVSFAAATLLLLYAAGRHPARGRPARRSGGRSRAVVVASVTVIASLAMTSLLPHPLTRIDVGGGSTMVDASLSLGDDLRQGVRREVIRVATEAEEPPYLRLATLTAFDGEEWLPDTGPQFPLDQGLDAFPPETSAGVETTRLEARIEVMDLWTSYLPVPSPLTDVSGAGGGWRLLPPSRTVEGPPGDSAGVTFTAVAEVPAPTPSQIRTADAGWGAARLLDQDEVLPAVEASTALPDEELGSIDDLAAEVTADASNDYDALIALQSWFRDGDFDYSLNAPVSDGFDGSDVDAMNAFLEVRAGYCVHFASTFAMMARSLGMPSRVVVGYLPGDAAFGEVEGMPVYSVLSDQLHAWPEVHFEGIGWIPFEPTASLGVGTSLVPPSEEEEEEASPLPTASADADEEEETPESPLPAETDAADAPDPAREGDPSPLTIALIALGTIAVLLLPAMIRLWRRLSRIAAADRGDARAAWREFVATVRDAGLPVHAHESPRALAERIADAGVPREALAPLVTAIEHASYAPADQRRSSPAHPPPVDGHVLVEALLSTRRALLSTAAARFRASFLPPSLFPRAFVGGDGAG